MPKFAHYMVAKVAREMAEELFELWASHNEVYRAFEGKKGRRRFIDRVAPTLFEDARQTLAAMLGRDDVDQRMKDDIYEALTLDAELRAARPVAASVAQVPARLH